MSDQIVFQEPIEEYPVYVSFQSADTRIGIIKRNNQKKFAYFPEKLVELKESDLEAILSKVRKLNAPRIAYRGLNDADARIAELDADNAEFRQLIRDWSIVLDQNNGFELSHVESVRQAMLEINKEREE